MLPLSKVGQFADMVSLRVSTGANKYLFVDSVQQDCVSDQSYGEDAWQSESPGESTGTSPKFLANQSGVKNPSPFAKTLKSLLALCWSSLSKSKLKVTKPLGRLLLCFCQNCRCN
jgi:hypothetical protein